MCIYVVACVTLNIEFIHMVIQLHSKIDIFNAINVELNTRTILAKIQNSYGANNQFNKPSNGMRHSVPIYVCVNAYTVIGMLEGVASSALFNFNFC